MGTAADVRPPRDLHPAFYGSYDWHSCVHMHWLLARVRRLQAALPVCADITAVFGEHLTPVAIEAEAPISRAPVHSPSSAPTDGRGCSRWPPRSRRMAARPRSASPRRSRRWSRPSSRAISTTCPGRGIRCGTACIPTAPSGWLSRSTTRADATRPALAAAVTAKALDWFGADRDLPARWEPSGADFLSPALMEADLMTRVLPREPTRHGSSARCPDWPMESRARCSRRHRWTTVPIRRSCTSTASTCRAHGAPGALPRPSRQAIRAGPLLLAAADAHLAAACAGWTKLRTSASTGSRPSPRSRSRRPSQRPAERRACAVARQPRPG